jgi:nucleotide-binding universal stress UspA family protein
MNQPANAIVVAVGYHGCDAAVEFAVAEAERAKSPIHLLQVTDLPDTAEYAGVFSPTMHDAEAALEQALAHARKLAGDSGIAVTGERAEDRNYIHSLVRHADQGQMMILQHRRIGALKRVVTGSTTNGVAARAAVPVISVPEDWSPSTDSSVVTVAVQDAGEASEILRAGFEQAQSRRASLVVLHAWWLANGYDVVVVDETMRRKWEERARSELTPAIDELKTEFPDVEVAVEVRHAPPTEALLDAAERSALLVIGRRHHLLPLGSHLGPHARATLNYSACPVLVVPPTR